MYRQPHSLHRTMTQVPESPVAPSVPRPVRTRCSVCRQTGHNRNHCPHDAVTATSLRCAYQRQEAEQRRAYQYRLHREFMQAMSEESQRRRRYGRCFPCTQDSVSLCKREIQNIVFENADKIPDGVYKQLMDALLIKD